MKKLLMLSFALVVSSCKQVATDDVVQDRKDTIVVTSYTVKWTQFYRHVEKFIIEGHEYLLFSSQIANPPFVVHSESCPCKNMENRK